MPTLRDCLLKVCVSCVEPSRGAELRRLAGVEHVRRVDAAEGVAAPASGARVAGGAAAVGRPARPPASLPQETNHPGRSLVFTRFYLVLQGFTQFYRVFGGYDLLLLGFS